MVNLLTIFSCSSVIVAVLTSASPVLLDERGTEIGNGRRPPSKLSSPLLARDVLIEARSPSVSGTEVGNGKRPPSKPGSSLKTRDGNLQERGTEIGNGRRPPNKLVSNLLVRDATELEERGIEAGNPGKPRTKAVIARDERAEVEKRAAGPSGQLLEPAGGTFIYTEVSWPGSGFHFVYKPVYQPNPDQRGCVVRRQACYAETKWLTVTLDSIDGTRSYKLADYLHVPENHSNIDVWLGVPQEAACGDYRVKVIEHQRYYAEWVSFQSAAPKVTMQCVRYAGPS